MYWEKDIETMDRPALERLQVERLQGCIARAAASPVYGPLFEKAGLSPASVRTVADIRRFPLTEKQQLRDTYPYGMVAVPRNRLVRMHHSSGTTGMATAVFHTQGDIDQWTNLLARSLYMVGLRPGDVFQNMMGYGLFTGGLGLHYGAERLGCLVLPTGAGNSHRQIQFMKIFGTTAVHVIPSYALSLLRVFAELGVDPVADLPLRVAVLGAEPHTEEIRRKIEQTWGVQAFNCYGLSEICGPGVAFECPEQGGLHIWEDCHLVEILDPKTHEPVPEGTLGELVITTLVREAMPLLRYRTKDLTRFITEPCPCGRTHRRLARITGRADDMLIIKGVNIFPTQIEQLLMSIPEVGNNYLIVLDRENFVDRLTVKVEVTERAFRGDAPGLAALQARIASILREDLQVTPRVELVEPDSIPRGEGKAVRVIDNRKE